MQDHLNDSSMQHLCDQPAKSRTETLDPGIVWSEVISGNNMQIETLCICRKLLVRRLRSSDVSGGECPIQGNHELSRKNHITNVSGTRVGLRLKCIRL